MKNKKIFIIILFILGSALIGISIFLSNKDYLQFSNLVITSDSSLSFLVTNTGSTKSVKQTRTFYFQDSHNNILIKTPIEIPEIDAKSEKRIEYQSEYIFNEKPTSFYVKKYKDGDDLENNNIALEANIANQLKELSKEVVLENNINTEELIMITANDLKIKYQKNLDFIKDSYGCDLEDTYVEINKDQYTSYINCKVFLKTD